MIVFKGALTCIRTPHCRPLIVSVIRITRQRRDLYIGQKLNDQLKQLKKDSPGDLTEKTEAIQKELVILPLTRSDRSGYGRLFVVECSLAALTA